MNNKWGLTALLWMSLVVTARADVPRTDYFGRVARRAPFAPLSTARDIGYDWSKPWNPLVILVDFPDKPAKVPKDYFAESMTIPVGAVGSDHSGTPLYDASAGWYRQLRPRTAERGLEVKEGAAVTASA